MSGKRLSGKVPVRETSDNRQPAAVQIVYLTCNVVFVAQWRPLHRSKDAVYVLENMWRAVAAQTVRCSSKVLSIPYILGPTKCSGTEDKSFAEKSGN